MFQYRVYSKEGAYVGQIRGNSNEDAILNLIGEDCCLKCFKAVKIDMKENLDYYDSEGVQTLKEIGLISD